MTFATCLNCIDGRTHLPLIEWVKKKYGVDYVDLITEPGMVELLACGFSDNSSLIGKIRISLEKHQSVVLVAAGHYDCAGCTKNSPEHRKDIEKAVEKIRAEFPGVAVCGVWINECWTVEEVVAP